MVIILGCCFNSFAQNKITRNHQNNQASKKSEIALPQTKEETEKFWFDSYPDYKKMVKAINILKKAHEKGNPFASQWIGLYYLRGWNINSDGVKSNYSEAVKWLQYSTENGNVSSYSNLAECYYYGRGVSKDISKAIELLEKAIELGDINAKKTLDFYMKNSNEN